MDDIAGDGNDNVVVYIHEGFSSMESNWHYDFIEAQRRNGLWRTIFHNLNTKWLPTNEDLTYWTARIWLKITKTPLIVILHGLCYRQSKVGY